MKFSIGYNHDIKLLHLLSIYRDHIEALYFPVPAEYLGSGRDISQSESYRNEIMQIIERCNSLHIKSQLLLNATCEGESGLNKNSFKVLISYIKKLRGLGLASVVVTNPLYARRIKKEINNISIESSVNCFVKTLEHALYLKDLGIDVLTIDRDINRNIPLIKEIKKMTNLKIKLMLNEGCLKNCPFRLMHYNYLSHHDNMPRNRKLMRHILIEQFCLEIYTRNPEKFFSIPFIPPDALKYYDSFIDYFKLSTRVMSTERIETCLKAYINQQVQGNLLEILDSPGLAYLEYVDYSILSKSDFFQKMIDCDNDCASCGYCNILFKKAVVVNRVYLNKKDDRDERKAIKIYKNALKSPDNKDHGFIYEKLSKAYFHLKKYKEALRSAYKVTKLMPRKTNGHLLLGSYYEQTKRINRALGAYKEALTINPLEGAAYLGLARIYLRIKKYQESIKMTNKLIGLDYRGSQPHLLLGLCYEKLGEYKMAIPELKKEEKLSPQDGRISVALARCYRNTGQAGLVNREIGRCMRKIKRRSVESLK